MDCSTPGLPVPHDLLKFAQIHVYCIGDAIQPFHPLTPILFSFCPQSFPASGTFPMSQQFASDDQNATVSASASVLPTSTQGWFPLRLTGLISLLSQQRSGVFSSTIVWRHQFFGAPPPLWSSCHNHMWPLGRPKTFVGRIMSLLLNTLSRFVMLSCQEANVFWFHGCSHHLQWFLGPRRGSLSLLPPFPFYLPWSNRAGSHDISFFLIFSFKPALSLSSFTLYQEAL